MRLYENEQVKGHIIFDSFTICVEYKRGETKEGVNKATGEPWEKTFYMHYGYFKGIEGADGDSLDVFVKPKSRINKPVYVFHNLNPEGTAFDEDKVFLGCNNIDEAMIYWRKHCHAPDIMFGGVSEYTLPEFTKISKNINGSGKVILAQLDQYNYLKNNNLLPKNLTSLAFNEYLIH